VALSASELLTAALTDRVADTDPSTLPLVPVTVKLALPRVAVDDAATVSTELAVAVELMVTDAGLKLPVTPVGNLVAVSATVPVKPSVGVTETVNVADWPRVTVWLAGAT
jgi:hypothetical protein